MELLLQYEWNDSISFLDLVFAFWFMTLHSSKFIVWLFSPQCLNTNDKLLLLATAILCSRILSLILSYTSNYNRYVISRVQEEEED